MKLTVHSSLALLVLCTLVFSPLAYAQESVPQSTPEVQVAIDSPVTAGDGSPAREESVSEDLAPISNESSVIIQDAAPAQDSIGGDVLESTVNPETATSTTAEIIEVDAASSTPDVIPVVEDSIPTEEEVLPLEQAVTLDTVSDMPADTAVPAPEVRMDAAPDLVIAKTEIDSGPEFVFSVGSKSIPTKRDVRTKDGDIDSVVAVSDVLTPQIDNAKGEISFAGTCSDTYFVVLLFKGANDYYDDPSSYILNKAYPCVGGRYAYSITDLPVNLQSGQYYLLVGQQGERGAWVPTTGLAEITINKK